MTNNHYFTGVKDGLPIGLGYLSVSFAFGIIAFQCGLNIFQSVLISFTNLTSAGQFSGVNILAAGGTLLELALTTFIINIRYMLMSFSLSQKIEEGTPWYQRAILSFGITDEIFAVASQRKMDFNFTYFMGLMTLPIIGWSLGTFLGAYSGNIFPQSIQNALGIMLYAMFIAIIVEPAKESKPITVVTLTAIAISCLFYFTPVLKELSVGWIVIIAALVSSGIGAVCFPLKGGMENE